MLHYRLLYNRFILFPQLEYNDTHYYSCAYNLRTFKNQRPAKFFINQTCELYI